MKEVTNESETKKNPLAYTYPTFWLLLVGNLPEPQKSHGVDRLLRKWWIDALYHSESIYSIYW